MKKIDKGTIGRLEYIGLPEFKLKKVVAKIDTGAYNGSIHAGDIEEKDGKLYFRLLDGKVSPKTRRRVVKDFKQKRIKSSHGKSVKRYVINTDIVLKGEKINVDLSLSNRDGLRYPVLLGRKIFKKHFIVDASKKFTK